MLLTRSAALEQRGQLEAEQRARAALALGVSEARPSALLDSLQTGCEHIGFDWRYLYVNEAAARHRGKPCGTKPLRGGCGELGKRLCFV